MILKILSYTLKLIGSILSKLGTKYTYTKLYKYLMRWKIISILYKPFKLLFSNVILFIKIASAIMAIFSIFNISLFYYNFDIIDEISKSIVNILNYIKKFINKWILKVDDDEEIDIYDPRDFLHLRKETKVLDKVTHQSSSNPWILPVMLIASAALYYFHPQIDLKLDDYINPIISKIDEVIPVNYTVFVSGMFVYKFVAISIETIFGINLDDDSETSDDSNKSSITKYFKEEVEEEKEPFLFTDEERENVLKFIKDSEETPKASTSALPPRMENPFKSKMKYKSEEVNTEDVKIENWDE